MLSRLSRALVPLGSGLVALVLSHSVVYLVRYGSAYGEALAHDGHGPAWTLAVWSIAVLGGFLAFAGLARLVALARGVASTGGTTTAPAEAHGAWLRDWLVAGIRLVAITVVLLTLQENAERAAAGLPLPGPLMLLRPDYPFALAIVIAVSFAVSLVVQLYRRRREELLARLRRDHAALPVARPLDRPRRTVLSLPASILGRIGGLRAPPLLLAS